MMTPMSIQCQLLTMNSPPTKLTLSHKELEFFLWNTHQKGQNSYQTIDSIFIIDAKSYKLMKLSNQRPHSITSIFKYKILKINFI